MIFVPCVGGISHNEIEDAKLDDLTAGCNVLLNAVLERARPAEERQTGIACLNHTYPLMTSIVSVCASSR